MEKLRHHLRTVVNVAAIVLTVFGTDEFRELVPPERVAAIAAVLNTILSVLRGRV